MDTYENYLGALGFNPPQQAPQQQGGTSFADADAARRTGDVQRQLAAAKGDLGLAGEQEREGINADWEERGLFKSGMRGNALAQQQGREASKIAMLEAGATADIGNIDADKQRQLAQEKAQLAQDAADKTLMDKQTEMSDLQLKYMQGQLNQLTDPNSIASQQLALARQQFEEQKKQWAAQLALQKKTSAGNDYQPGNTGP